jgi:hypothetical protein
MLDTQPVLLISVSSDGVTHELLIEIDEQAHLRIRSKGSRHNTIRDVLVRRAGKYTADAGWSRDGCRRPNLPVPPHGECGERSDEPVFISR